MFGARGRVSVTKSAGVMMRRFVGGATRDWNASTSTSMRQQQQQQQRQRNDNVVAVRTRRRRVASTSAMRDEGVTYVCEDERATERLARALAGACRAGDVLCLRGRVGAGKSAFARAFVRATFGDATMDVPSPTYLVQQRYEGFVGAAGGRTTPSSTPTTREVHHYDLYRLSDEEEIRAMVDLDESVNRATSLIEWSERLGQLTPSERLDVYVSVAEKDAPGVVVRGGAEEDYEEVYDDDDEDDDDEVDEAYVDKAHRSYRFVPNGGDWESRLAALKV